MKTPETRHQEIIIRLANINNALLNNRAILVNIQNVIRPTCGGLHTIRLPTTPAKRSTTETVRLVAWLMPYYLEIINPEALDRLRIPSAGPNWWDGQKCHYPGCLETLNGRIVLLCNDCKLVPKEGQTLEYRIMQVV